MLALQLEEITLWYVFVFPFRILVLVYVRGW